MPWRERSAMQEKASFILEWESGQHTFRALCKAFGISRTLGYRYVLRYVLRGPEGLREQSRAPRRVWNRTAPEVERAIGGLFKLAGQCLTQRRQRVLGCRRRQHRRRRSHRRRGWSSSGRRRFNGSSFTRCNFRFRNFRRRWFGFRRRGQTAGKPKQITSGHRWFLTGQNRNFRAS